MTPVDLLTPSCALFLDFDGTLVDIAPEPELVRVPPDLVELLLALQGDLGGALAVVSGRPIAQIDHFLAPLRLPAAGEHGAERRDRAGRLFLLPTRPLHRVEETATALARRHAGLRVEVKRGSVALHYRQAPMLEADCLAAMQAAVDDSPGLVLLRGKMVAEAKAAHIGKGQAIESFLSEPPFHGRTPVFAGDDMTDEPGFSVVQALGGAGIKIGEGATAARHRLAAPTALRQALAEAVGSRLPGGTQT
jgi:trehalose 6-phosphate phosphatase